jgi:hypothetical protein
LTIKTTLQSPSSLKLRTLTIQVLEVNINRREGGEDSFPHYCHYCGCGCLRSKIIIIIEDITKGTNDRVH